MIFCSETVAECSYTDRIRRLQQELQQYKGSQQCLRIEISQMKKAIERLEMERQEIHAEKHHVREELDCVLTMCAQLKTNKDKICVLLEEKDLQIAKMQGEKRELISHLDAICTQLKSERDRMKEMDVIIEERRRREQLSQGSVQNLITDLKCAHKELCSAEKKLSNVCQGLKFLENPPLCLDDGDDYAQWVPFCQPICQERRNKDLENCIDILADLVKRGCQSSVCNPFNIHECPPCCESRYLKQETNKVKECPSQETWKDLCFSPTSDTSRSSDAVPIRDQSPTQQTNH